ncbi:DUF6412 domain-containing protein [Streptomyces niveiscabiei]|uniref:DUF6412 domain-containing protein n=1 Tax=Streptomyces niveiscabiei TaxID=164115 RepID=UPI0029B5B709|nr:DUF6412 domain-containing protein [Streptomyces niveiscabiei]MDX3383590.1 DUF6412 domain-containing protein [Streptomyces niveiscabiei]
MERLQNRFPVRAFASLLVLLAGALLLDTGPLSVTLAVAAAIGSAFALCRLLAARCAPPVPGARIRTAIRDRARRTAFLPQRDPDASGRSRPRAPGLALRTTTA